MSLLVKEIYPAIIGEGIFAGWSGLIVRLSGCNLNCIYCDTRYAKEGGRRFALSSLVEMVDKKGFEQVLITGGEPLLQKESIALMRRLLKAGKKVILETNGSLDISAVPRKVHIIMDLKTPSSGEEKANLYENLNYLKKTDEVKIVLVNRRDYLWAKELIKRYNLERFQLSFSPAWGFLSAEKLAHWILKDRLNIRLNLQLHKLIFPGKERRV